MNTMAVAIDDARLTQILFDNLDTIASAIESRLDVTLTVRHSQLIIAGDDDSLATAAQLVERLKPFIASGKTVDEQCIDEMLAAISSDLQPANHYRDTVIATTYRGDTIVAKNEAQAQYAQAIEQHDIVFGLGPAGTGKTYLAVAMAVRALKRRAVDKIIITRPAVEAGEQLGFLPGDLKRKIEPYLKPIDDALNSILGRQRYGAYWDKGVIDIVPLAYMRGRTLDNAFIILDEAQNASIEQMKMFLTRIGRGSKVVVNGDASQVDLAAHRRSGLLHASDILKHIAGVTTIVFSERDVVRHQLVKAIIAAYQREDTCDA